MKNSTLLKAISLSIISMITITQAGCAPAPSSANTSTSNSGKTTTDSTNTSVTATEKTQTQFILFKDDNGVSNPVTPDQIEYLQLNGTKILAKDIQIVKTNDKLTGDVRFNGSGNYSFDQTTNNKDILVVKFVGSDKEQTIPLFKPGNEGFTVKANDSTSYQFRLVFNADGSVSGVTDSTVNGTTTSNNAFTVSSSGFTYYNADGSAVSGSLSDLSQTSQNISVTNANPSVVLQQVITQLQDKQHKTSVDGYIGIWSKTILGSSVSVSFRKSGSKKFKISTLVAGKTFSSEGQYPDGETPASDLTVDATVGGNSVKVKIENPSENVLKFTLLSSDLESAKPFMNIPVELDRVLIGL